METTIFQILTCIITLNYVKNSIAVPPDYCLEPLNGSDCHAKPVMVFHYYKPGSRCELTTWRGCPTLNMFENQYDCVHLCVYRFQNKGGDIDVAQNSTEKNSHTVSDSSPNVQDDTSKPFEEDDINTKTETLQDYIREAKFPEAVNKSVNLYKINDSVITDAVVELIQERESNLICFLYQLWSTGHEDIVEELLPEPFSRLFSKEDVLIVDKAYNLAIKLDERINTVGDRKAFGSKINKREQFNWKILPIWDENCVHFKLKNVATSMILKMAHFFVREDTKDRAVFATDKENEKRFYWNFVPVISDRDILFLIKNREFGQPLTFDLYKKSLDFKREKRVCGQNTFREDDKHLQWYVESFDVDDNLFD